ncbi:unnamed protein product, partial [Adineta steineri]
MVVFIPFYPIGKDSRTFCILRAYLTAVSTTLLTSSFLLQALSRLFHTVFPMNRRCLLTWKFHYFLIAVQWMMGFLTPITILINHENIIYRTGKGGHLYENEEAFTIQTNGAITFILINKEYDTMFEDLPDEILMIIFRYSGDTYTILTTYLGLNQRINRILIDKHLHLLTNFLYTKYNSDYYDSEIFQNASQQLLMINSNIDKTKLDEIFRPLIPFHIRQTYIQQGQEFQLLTEQHNSIRQNLSNDEKRQVDCEVKVQFWNLNKLDRSIETFQNIKKLILKQGAR